MALFKSTKQTEKCPECGSVLKLKQSKKGLFLGCSAYPKCEYIKPLNQTSHIIKELNEHCPECGAKLQLKQGHYGIFIGCSHYPECHFIVHEQAEIEDELNCPECKIHKLVARRGRSGKTFYACSGFPECKFTLPSKPIKHQCPNCNCELAIIKKIRGKQIYICADKECQHQTEITSNE